MRAVARVAAALQLGLTAAACSDEASGGSGSGSAGSPTELQFTLFGDPVEVRGYEQAPASSEAFVDQVPNVRAVPHTAPWSPTEAQADEILAELFYGRVDREAGIDELIDRTTPLLGQQL